MSLNSNFGFWQAIPFVSSAPGAFTGGRFVAIRFGPSTDARYSGNGDIWTASTIQSGNWYDACWSASHSRFVAVAEDSKISYSSDGISWTASTNTGTTHHSITWAPGFNMFLAGSGTNNQNIITSTDKGLTWTAQTTGFGTTTPEALAYSPTLNMAVAVGGSTVLQTSSNGTTWTTRTATASFWHSALWCTKGYFMVGDITAGNGIIATSSNGIDWSRNVISGRVFRGLAYSPTLDLFVGANFGGVLIYSSNGISWTASTSVTKNWWDVQWSPETARFVAINTSDTKLYWSSDAKAWTASTTTVTSGTWAALAYAPGLGSDF